MYGHIAAMARAVKKGVDSVDGVEGILYQVCAGAGMDMYIEWIRVCCAALCMSNNTAIVSKYGCSKCWQWVCVGTQ